MSTTYEIAGVLVRDWKVAWLAADDPFEAFGVWLDAKWDAVEPHERLAFALSFGWPPYIDHALAYDEHGDLREDTQLSIWAYANDPDVPSHMIEPTWHDSWPRDDSDFPF